MIEATADLGATTAVFAVPQGVDRMPRLGKATPARAEKFLPALATAGADR
jgi:hypothetical protein